MGREFDLSVSVKDSRMIAIRFPLIMISNGPDRPRAHRPVGIGGRDGVAIGLKFDKAGLGDGGQDDPIGTIGDRRKGFSFSSFSSTGAFSVVRWIL